MKAALTGLALALAACGGRSELARWEPAEPVQPGSGAGVSEEPEAPAVEFPSLAETIAVPQPATAPPARARPDP